VLVVRSLELIKDRKADQNLITLNPDFAVEINQPKCRMFKI